MSSDNLFATLTEHEGNKAVEEGLIMSEVAQSNKAADEGEITTEDVASPSQSSMVGGAIESEEGLSMDTVCGRGAAAESARSSKTGGSGLAKKSKRVVADDDEQSEALPGAKKPRLAVPDSDDEEDEQPLSKRGKGAAAESARSSQGGKPAGKAAAKPAAAKPAAAAKATGKRKEPEKTYGHLEVPASKVNAYQKFLHSGKSDQDWEKQEEDKRAEQLKKKVDKEDKIKNFDKVKAERDDAWEQLEKEKQAKKDEAKKVKRMRKALEKLSDMLIDKGGDADEIAKIIMKMTQQEDGSSQ